MADTPDEPTPEPVRESIRRMLIGDSMRVYREDRVGVICVTDQRGMLPAGAPSNAIRARVDSTTGFLHVPKSNTARSGNLTYSDGQTEWVEFRSDAALAASVDSFSNLIFTLGHPPVLVTTDNVAQFEAGHTGRADFANGFMTSEEIVITRKDAIGRAQQPGGLELSIGFLADVMRVDGEYDGVPHQFIQTNLEGNHHAGVDVGRAGPECRLAMDSAATTTALFVADEAIEQQQPTTGDAMSKENDPQETPVEEVAAPEVKTDEAPTAPIELTPAPERDQHAAMIRQRCAILDSAKAIVGNVDHNADDPTIMLAVIAKVDGEDTMKALADKGDEYIRASFDAAVRSHERQSRVDTASQIAAMTGVRVNDAKGEKLDLNKAHHEMTSYLRDAHKAPAAHTEPKSR